MPSNPIPTSKPFTTIRKLTLIFNASLLLTSTIALILTTILAIWLSKSSNPPSPIYNFFYGPFLPSVTILHTAIGIFLTHFKNRLTSRPSHVFLRFLINLIFLIAWASHVAGWWICDIRPDAVACPVRGNLGLTLPRLIVAHVVAILYLLFIPVLSFAVHEARKAKKLQRVEEQEEKRELAELRIQPRYGEGLEPIRYGQQAVQPTRQEYREV